MRGLLICIFLCLAGPAFADTTAVYEAPGGVFRMTVQIAANGDMRGDMAGQPGVYVLTLGGQGYFVIQTPSGVVVDRVEDEVAAVKAVAEKRLSPSYMAMMQQVAADPELAKLKLIKGDEVVVQGRKGTAYYFPGPRDPENKPVVVISTDPELAPIGAAMSGQFAILNKLQFMGSPNPLGFELEAIMRGGAPISFAGAKLTTVSHEPIPPSRFELPAAPSSLETIIKRIDATATDQRVTAF